MYLGVHPLVDQKDHYIKKPMHCTSIDSRAARDPAAHELKGRHSNDRLPGLKIALRLGVPLLPGFRESEDIRLKGYSKPSE
jgi:hypothetical protein